jgi:FkbM family methyltransferase
MTLLSDLTKCVRQPTQGVLRRLGFEIARYYDPSYLAIKRVEILREQRIDLVLDVGANAGQYACALRASGFRGRIVSFEPTSEPFRALQERVEGDQAWSCEHVALSDSDGEAAIHISANSWSSSLLPMASQHADSAPGSIYVGSEMVRVSRLDSLAPQLLGGGDRVYLKLDVQGHELCVLLGAEATLDQVHAVECELTVTPLYEGQALIDDVLEYLRRRAFGLVALEPGFSDPRTGQVLQFDGLFIRRDAGFVPIVASRRIAR